MSKKLKSLAAFIVLGCSVLSLNTQAYTIDDPYGPQFNSSNCSTDHCGGSDYDTAGINVSQLNQNLNISVFTNFAEPNSSGIRYGDLFLTVDGIKFVLDTSSAQQNNGIGNLYQITNTTSLIKAGQATPYAGRPNQDVLYGSGGNLVGSFNFSILQSVNQPYQLSYSVQDLLVGFTPGDTLDLLWAMTCGNDVVQGLVTTQHVPSPGTLLLILGGGLAMLHMRRAKVVSNR